jgi:hypothetical protein
MYIKNSLFKIHGKSLVVKRLFPTDENKISVFIESTAFLFGNSRIVEAEMFNTKLQLMFWLGIDLFITEDE